MNSTRGGLFHVEQWGSGEAPGRPPQELNHCEHKDLAKCSTWNIGEVVVPLGEEPVPGAQGKCSTWNNGLQVPGGMFHVEQWRPPRVWAGIDPRRIVPRGTMVGHRARGMFHVEHFATRRCDGARWGAPPKELFTEIVPRGTMAHAGSPMPPSRGSPGTAIFQDCCNRQGAFLQ